MTALQCLFFRFRWLHLPTTLLVVLLQRTPVLRLLCAEGPAFVRFPADLLRSAFVLGALGAYDTVAGATTFNATAASPATVSPGNNTANKTFAVGGQAGSAFSLSISGSGAPSTIKSWKITGSLPPGLAITGASASGSAFIYNGLKVTLAGTPSAAANSTLTFTAYDSLNASGNNARVYCAVNIQAALAVAPAFTTQPRSQTVKLDDDVTFTAVVTGTPAPTLQWYKDDSPLPGKTSATLFLPRVQPADAGTYTVVATNLAAPAGVPSFPATLTLGDFAPTPAPIEDPGSLRTGSVVSWNLAEGITPPAGLVFKAVGLPAGLKLDAATGLITGTIIAKPGSATITTWTQLGANKSPLRSVALSIGAFPAELTGARELLLRSTGEVPLPAGKVTLNVAANGTFTGTLLTDDLAGFKLLGRLSLAADNNSASVTLGLARGKTLPAYALVLGVLPDGLSASLSAGAGALASAADGARVLALAPAGSAGRCTLLLSAPENLGVVAEAPLGLGHATGTINAKGVLAFSGKTADAAKITGSCSLGADHTYRLYLKPYAKQAGGFLAGPLPLSARGDTRWHVAPADGADVFWRKPAPAAASPNYGSGFGPVGLVARLEPWTPPSAAAPLGAWLGLGPDGNLAVTVKATGLDGADPADPYGLPDLLHLGANTFSVLGDNGSALFSAKLAPSTGALSGSFTLKAMPPVAKRVVPWSGVLLQTAAADRPGLLGGGFFLLPASSSGGPVFSGKVELATPAP